jgi:hypothetical protein
MAEQQSPPNYAGMTKDQRYAAIAAAGTLEELDAMWAEWRRTGSSPEGMLHAAVLERRAALGAELTDEEQATIELVQLRRDRGHRLPPARARGSLGPHRGR